MTGFSKYCIPKVLHHKSIVPSKLLEISKNIKSSAYFVKYSCAQENIIETSKSYSQRK